MGSSIGRSPEEWDELIRRLRIVIADKNRSAADRERAQSILASALRQRPEEPTNDWLTGNIDYI